MNVSGRLATLKHTALITVSGAAGWSPPHFPSLYLLMGVLLVSLWWVSWLLQLVVMRFLTAFRLHLEVGANTVVLRHGAAEINDTTLVHALVWRLDAGETELVGDVASSHFDNLIWGKKPYIVNIWYNMLYAFFNYILYSELNEKNPWMQIL